MTTYVLVHGAWHGGWCWRKVRTLLEASGDKPFGQPRTVRADGIEDYHELRTGHDAMVTSPQEVAALLR
jgi:hypothetical protein